LGHNYPNSSCEDTTDTDGNFSRGTASFESNSTSCSTDNSYESDWVNHVGEFDSSSLPLHTHVVTESANDINNGSWNAIQPGMVEEFSASVVPREKRSHKKNVDDTCNELEGRGRKLPAIFSDELEPPEILDEVLLCQAGRTQNQQASNNLNSGGKAKGTGSRSKKVSTTNNAPAVDLW
ncbi:GRAS family transcription factor, partial [Trifolium pratense]